MRLAPLIFVLMVSPGGCGPVDEGGYHWATQAEAKQALDACGFKEARFGRYNRFMGRFGGQLDISFVGAEGRDKAKHACLDNYLDDRKWLVTRSHSAG